ncbi:MAG: ubiquinone/menaquinone biosynthesis methyltransferase [Pseudomonadota bacterium]|jgi:demethylmenaquinone methyltransferase/2-methoxy-6-polyprenyl-1,4-benzoquinol methylase
MNDKAKSTDSDAAPRSAPGTASFGFREVPEDARQGLVNDVFQSVAERYDLMNDLMSAGVHRLWKAELISQLNPPRGQAPFHLLDVAGGTGDIALRYLDRGGPACRVTLADISPEMLEVGRRRIARSGHAAQATVVEANAESLPFADATFDAYTIAFGIRNVTHIDRALAEAYRVLKPGGRFLCLEFSQCQVPLLDRLYDLHSFNVIPRLGELAAGSAEPYQYLVESIRRFPNQEAFAAMIRAAGFERVAYRNMTGGIAAIHSGWRI